MEQNEVTVPGAIDTPDAVVEVQKKREELRGFVDNEENKMRLLREQAAEIERELKHSQVSSYSRLKYHQ